MPSDRDMTALIKTIIINRTTEADDVISLTLRRADLHPLPNWGPGAHVDLILPNGTIRQYSLCSDPRNLDTYSIAVLKQPLGKGGSVAVHELMQVGSTVMISAPRNRFPLVAADSYLLVAGGIGITPLLAMARELDRTDRLWRLIYGGRTSSSMAFQKTLGEFNSVELFPEDECGRLDLETIAKSAVPGSAVYCCGPEVMINTLASLCTALPSAAVSFHSEQFSKSPRSCATQGVADSSEKGAHDRPFRVVMSSSGQTITVQPGQSILEAARVVQPRLVSSCEEGHCGTCETAVLAGLPDHRDEFLTDDEQDANDTMMICVSRSLSEELELDL